MAMGRDGKTGTSTLTAIVPKADRTATTSATIDRLGYQSVLAIFHFGVVTDGGWTPSITVGDASNGSDATAPDASELVGTLTKAEAASDNVVQTQAYIGSKRYITVNITETDASTTGAEFSACVHLSNPDRV
jgi:hypothetical protein